MKKFIILSVIVAFNLANAQGQCPTLFSYGANFETVSFINQSSIANAYYFWNFGDGTGSNYENPVHQFPETGNYLVTLFGKDQATGCSSYYEIWVNVTKYSSDICQTSITDNIFIYNSDYFLEIIDNSTNCNGYLVNYDSGPALDLPPNNSIWLGNNWHHARFLSRVQYFTYDIVNGYVVQREAYKTSPFLYSNTKNFDDCSANFEFTVYSEDAGGQKIFFKAMNSSAVFYEWEITGFGNPIISNNDTVSQYYPYDQNNFWLVGLKTIGSTGCRDTLYQNILTGDIAQTITYTEEIKDQSAFGFYPNPFINQTIIYIPSGVIKPSFLLYNSNEMLIKQVDKIACEQLQLNREGLPAGMYYYIIYSDSKIVTTGKLIAK